MHYIYFPALVFILFGGLLSSDETTLSTENSRKTTETLTSTSITNPLSNSDQSSYILNSTDTNHSDKIAESATTNPSQENTNLTTDSKNPENVTAYSAESITQETAPLGSETNPYLAGDIQDLKPAAQAPMPEGSSAFHIQLTADILYNTETVSFSKNTTINGLKDASRDATDPSNHYAILYTGKNYANTNIATSTSKLTITFKNVNFGNETYPDNTYYGFIQLNNGSNTIVVENLCYNIRNGAQPFYAGGSNNQIILKGKNSFTSNGQSYGGEFAEGYERIIFDNESDTTIYSDSNGATALFWSSPTALSVGDTARVSIKSSKWRFFYGNNFSIDIGKNAFFSFEKIKPVNNLESGSSSYNEISNSDQVTINLGTDSRTIFTSQFLPIDMKTTVITANEPDYLLFDFPIAGKNFFSGTISLTRPTITSTADYQMNYLSNSTTNSLVQHFLPGHTETLNSSNPSAVTQSLMYNQTLALTGVSGTPTVTSGVSKIETDITGYSPPNRSLNSIEYLLAPKRLYDNQHAISADSSQSEIETAASNDSTIKKATVTLNEENSQTKTIFNHLEGGTYYLYARATSNEISGFTTTSLWVETEITLNKVINASIPIQMSFESPSKTFGKEQNKANYKILNNGNVPISVALTSVKATSTSDSEVKLVASPVNDFELLLNLATTYTDGTASPLIWGPLSLETVPTEKIHLTPFWEDKNQTEIYLSGQYAGPIKPIKKVNYQFTFTINPQEENNHAR